MARQTRLKVYRTPIGFHDAYVAAPSQKAALKAWGSAHDLFNTGEAELVTDAALTVEPLAKPGTIVRRIRGTAAEHIAALPVEPIAPAPKPPADTPKAKAAAPKPRPPKPLPQPRPPKPDRGAVDAAKAELQDAATGHAKALKDLKQREEALRQERQSLEQAHREAASSLRARLDKAEADYARAMTAWRQSADKE